MNRRARAKALVRSAQLPGTLPPARNNVVATPENSTSLHTVYRAVEILINAGAQLSIDAKRQGLIISNPPAILRRPSLSEPRDEFIESSLMSLIFDGNLFWLRREVDGELIALEALNPFMVGVNTDHETGRKYFQYQGKTYTENEIVHRSRMKLPGQVRGRSVIQAAREDMESALKTRNYASGVFDDHRSIDGILKSEQVLNQDDATKAKRAFKLQNMDTGEPTGEHDGLRVLGKGLEYIPLGISPKDAQWLESQSFNVGTVARMFGVPAHMLMAAVEGSSMTYSNVEQVWIDFVRFTLDGYMRKIESAWTELLPNGQTAVVNYGALLKSDTKTRYEAHALALQNKWMTQDEVRDIENLPPLTDAQREQIKSSAPAVAPTAPTQAGADTSKENNK